MPESDIYPIPGFQEPFSCWSHLVAASVFAILGVFLVRRGRGDWRRTLSLSVMVVTSLFLLSMSAVYHMLGPGPGRFVMRQLDLAAIFALIAGTVTPVHAILFRGFHRWAPLVLVWGAAATGITMTAVFSRSLPRGVTTACFLALGWGGAISCVVLWRRYGFDFIKPLVWGGVAYSLGVVPLGLRWPVLIPGVIGPHELWHVAALAGLGLHWWFVFQFASGAPPRKLSRSASPA